MSISHPIKLSNIFACLFLAFSKIEMIIFKYFSCERQLQKSIHIEELIGFKIFSLYPQIPVVNAPGLSACWITLSVPWPWRTLLIQAFWRQEAGGAHGQPGLQNGLKNSQDCYTERPCLQKLNKPKPPKISKRKEPALLVLLMGHLCIWSYLPLAQNMVLEAFCHSVIITPPPHILPDSLWKYFLSKPRRKMSSI